jgi:hypothetical protein
VIQLTVNDGTLSSQVDQVVITATGAATNSPPVADAGADQNVESGKAVTLDGSGSSDADGDQLTYKWEFVSFPGAQPSFDDDTKVFPRFTPNQEGTYAIKLVVHDGMVDSQADYTKVIADDTTVNQKPVASIAATIATDNYVYLDGTASSDPDNDTITSYSWSVKYNPDGSTATIEGGGALVRFKADRSGGYGVTLIVSDGSVNSDPAVQVVDVN